MGRVCKSPCETRANARHQMVVSNVDMVEGIANGGNYARMSMPEVEDAAIRMAVEESASIECVVKENTFAPSHDDVEAEFTERRDLSG